MIVIGKSIAALNMICDIAASKERLEQLSIYNNLHIEGDFIYAGVKIPEVGELSGYANALGAVLPQTKYKIVNQFPVNYLSLIHRSAIFSVGSKHGTGFMAGELSVVCGGTKIGDYVTLYCNSSINHDCEIGDFVTICPGVTICGNVRIGEGAFIGAGSVIKNDVTIGKNAVIGCGSNVIRDVPGEVTSCGNPSKILIHA